MTTILRHAHEEASPGPAHESRWERQSRGLDELGYRVAPRDTAALPPIFLMYAFRYALGRMSHAVGDVADALITHEQHLRPEWRTQIVRDIDQAVAAGQAGMDMDMDIALWRQIADHFREPSTAERLDAL